MKAIVESKIPFLADRLAAIGGVELTVLPAAGITPDAVRDADALFVRTRTRCDSALLSGSKIKFLATATIGTDHIDTEFCRAREITVANAPGCNAPAVAQWVMAAAETLRPEGLAGLTIGIVGVGHVGSIVSAYARSLGMNVIEHDPPRGLDAGLEETAARADILTFHTPLTLGGPCPTHHLFDSRLAEIVKPGAIVMNAARGAVTDTRALIHAREKRGAILAIDCWEGEPDINAALLAGAAIATPHIAGYSLQGKQRASQMVLDAFRRYIGLDDETDTTIARAAMTLTPGEAAASYDIMADTRALRAAPAGFEQLRNSYTLRNEILTNPSKI